MGTLGRGDKMPPRPSKLRAIFTQFRWIFATKQVINVRVTGLNFFRTSGERAKRDLSTVRQ